MADMRYMDQLVPVVGEAVALLQEKSRTYGDSWKKRGGAGAYFTVVRPWDRLEKIVERHGGDIFAAVAADPTGADGSALACVRDVMNYMILVEAECRVNHGTLPHSQEGERTLPPPPLELTDDLIVPPGTAEDGGHLADMSWLDDHMLSWAGVAPPMKWGASVSAALEAAAELGWIRSESDATLTPAGLERLHTLIQASPEVTQEAEGAGEPAVAPPSPDDRVSVLQARIVEAARDLGFEVNVASLEALGSMHDAEIRVRVTD